jgi:tetratricopeptide (TPR) repeat protein
MKRALIIVLLLALDASAAEKFLENYNKGVEAVNARRYAEAIPLLSKAIAERPTEGTELKVSLTVVAAYTPHFWLGIAKFNVGDVDGALREWRISEEQGAIAKTPYYSRLKDWVARAQTEKQLQAEKAASGAKKNADAAIRRAVELQGNALSAGGDRTEAYRDAQRKLQDALARFRQAGTNSAAYESVAQTAEQAAQSFGAAAEEGKRIRAAAANRPKPAQVQPPKPLEVVVPFDDEPPVKKPEPVKPEPVVTQTTAPPPPKPTPVITIEKPKPAPVTPTTTTAPTTTAAPVAAPKVDVTPAYRAFAMGDLTTAENLLNAIIARSSAAEAFLLRGCVRYTRAMLSRTPDPLLLAAADDFRAALDRNRALRLDRRVFSPKLVERFEQVRRGR